MKFYGKAPIRISLCNGGDTDYYIKAMGWGNLINATLSSFGYSCILEPNKESNKKYYYTNIFIKKQYHAVIKNIYKNKNDNIKLVTEAIRIINPAFRGDVRIITNIPEKSGLGGSSSLVVSLIKALLKSKNEYNVTPEELSLIHI